MEIGQVITEFQVALSEFTLARQDTGNPDRKLKEHFQRCEEARQGLIRALQDDVFCYFSEGQRIALNETIKTFHTGGVVSSETKPFVVGS